jgi:HEAT repeat protein
LGELDETQSYDVARRLAGDKSPGALLNRLIAARILKRHQGATVEELLAELAADSQPAVQAIALGHMYRLSPDLVLPMIKDVVQSKDAAVRRWGAQSLIARPSSENLVTLARLLDDRDPALRRDVCDALLLFTADEKWRDTVIAQARDALSREGWRQQEQAILLLVTLDDKTIADRLIELLGAERAEAHATAAWGLSRLQVPETAGPILKVLKEKTERFQAGDSVGDRIQLQLAHLAEAMGQLRYSAAKKVLVDYIPKNSPLPDIARCAAIWALGHLSENEGDAELINLLQLRMVDVNSMEPEVAEVRTMAAVSLGRLKAVETLTSMRAMLRIEKIRSAAGYSCAWAIREFTSEPIPELGPAVFPYNGWFLMPTGE